MFSTHLVSKIFQWGKTLNEDEVIQRFSAYIAHWEIVIACSGILLLEERKMH